LAVSSFETSHPRGRALLAAILAVGALALLLRAPVAGLPFERDEGEYAYLAWRWLEGDVPYLQGFDQKPPGVLAVYAALQAILGDSPRAIHWGAQLYTLGTLALLVTLGRRWFSLRVGAAGAALCALALAAPGTLGNAANVELFALLPLVGGVLAAARGADTGRLGPAVLAGVAGGAALAFKPVVLPIVAFAALLLLLRRPHAPAARARLAAGFAAGGLLVWLPLVAYFASRGALAALFDATVRFNLAYGSRVPLEAYPLTLRRGAADVLPLLGPMAALALLGPLLRLGRGRGAGTGRPEWRWGLGWLASSALAVSAGGHFRPHYFQLAVPPLALLAAAGLDEACGFLPGPRARRAALAAGVAAWLGAQVALDGWYFGPGDPAEKLTRLYGPNPFAAALPLAAFLAERSRQGDPVFVFGSEPELLVYAHRRQVGRYILAYHYLMGPPDDMRARQREVLAALETEPPRFVVAYFMPSSLLEHAGTPPDLRLGLAARIRREYRPVALIGPPVGPGTELVTEGPRLRRFEDGGPLAGRARRGQTVVWERRDDAA
jgi:4-amino-4-deoxy-L-arabinose transferase-like glycosyltransferase